MWILLPKVSVGCRVEGHGVFYTLPSAFVHTMKTGCPSCTHHGFQPELPAYYYVNTISRGGEVLLWKGGITNDLDQIYELNIDERTPYFQDCDYEELHRIYFKVGRDAPQLERNILMNLRLYALIRLKGWQEVQNYSKKIRLCSQ